MIFFMYQCTCDVHVAWDANMWWYSCDMTNVERLSMVKESTLLLLSVLSKDLEGHYPDSTRYSNSHRGIYLGSEMEIDVKQNLYGVS